ncbi:hypothetical protein [Metaplanococcus flavidus]|uniref:Uncharacterized protein n=1 Tax=Metaplanococcus flavidus TaxID=569883 RepID=A0ABW3LEA4_9BACL
MRKYWKSMAIVIGIVLGIGTFYVNSAMSAENYPDFAIQTLSGDPEEVESLVLDGSYIISSPANYVSTDLKITAQGSSYHSRSFLDRIIGYYPTVIKELQEEHRTFMRGKHPMVNLFFEDNEFLAYAYADHRISSLGPNNFNFEISVLNKADDKVNSFTLEVPDEENVNHVFVIDVQLVEDTIYIITQNMMRNNEGFNDEMHIYEIDLVSQELTNNEALLKYTQWNEDIHTHIQLVENSPTAANKHIILLKMEEAMMEAAESIRVTDSKQEIIFYNLATKENETVNVPGLSLEENQLSFVEGSTIYFTRIEEQELIITPYRLGENQVDQDFRIQLQATIENEPLQIPMISVKEGKLYVVSYQMDSNSNGDVVVVDIQTGKTLFEGQIALETSSEEQGKFELYLNEIYIN